jgi:hypothetical protein
MRKALCVLLAATALFCTAGARSSQAPGYLQKQFVELDSALSIIPRMPQARMKEVEPVNGLFRKIIARYPDIEDIFRTNSKGVVVNEVDRQGRNDLVHTDVGDSAWYAEPKKTMGRWYGPFVKENKRQFVVWSIPLFVTMPAGGTRFAGIVAFKIDVFSCFKNFAAHAGSPFEILLDGKSLYYLSWTENMPFDESDVELPGDIVLQLRTAKPLLGKSSRQSAAATIAEPAHQPAIADTPHEMAAPVNRQHVVEQQAKIEDTIVALQTDALPSRKVASQNVWLILAAIALLLTLVFLAALINGRFRRRAPVEKDALAPDQIDVPLIDEELPVSIEPYKKIPEIAVESFRELAMADQGDPALESTASPLSSELAFVPAQQVSADPPVFELSTEDREHIALREKGLVEAEYAENIRNQAVADLTKEICARVKEEHAGRLAVLAETELKDEIRRAISADEREELARETRTEIAREAKAEAEREVRDALAQEIRSRLSDEIRTEVLEKHSDEIYKSELETLTAAVRQQLIEKEMPEIIESHRNRLSVEICAKVVASLSESYEEKARESLRAEISRKVVDEETERLCAEETGRLRDAIREKLASEEGPKLSEDIRRELTMELRQTIGATELDAIRENMLGEMKSSIREELLTTDHDRVRAQQLEKLEKELYAEIEATEQDRIRAAILDKITNEAREQVDTVDRRTIIEAEKQRLLAEETPALREQIRLAIRQEELQTLRESAKAEIYAETVDSIRSEIAEKSEQTVMEKLADIKEGLGKKVRTDLRTGLQEEYKDLMENVEKLSVLLANNEALQSLGQTVALLSEEKKKYKYFNLNAAQTESLLDYLRRIHARFNIYTDGFDQHIRELMLKLGSVKNKLDNEA